MRFAAQVVRSPSPVRSSRARAFTFTEMLIVIGIIALLMSILLPSVGRVREQANLALCQNNMKKLYDVMALAGTKPNSSPNFLPAAGGWVELVEKENCMANLVCPLDEKREGKTSNDPSGGLLRFLGSPPASADFGVNESSSQFTCFRERSAYTLPQSVSVDLVPSGGGGTVPGGTVVDSFFLIFDPVGHSSASISGTVTFSGEILGVIFRAGLLNKSDAICGSPTTTYPSSTGGRGVEEGEGKITIAADRQTLVISGMYSGGVGESVRVLVAQGGMTSYAMNFWAGETWGRSDQILFVEYNKAIVNLETGTNPPDDLSIQLAPRHRRKLNVLYNHGGFEIMTASELITRSRSAPPVNFNDPEYLRIWKR